MSAAARMSINECEGCWRVLPASDTPTAPAVAPCPPLTSGPSSAAALRPAAWRFAHRQRLRRSRTGGLRGPHERTHELAVDLRGDFLGIEAGSLQERGGVLR